MKKWAIGISVLVLVGTGYWWFSASRADSTVTARVYDASGNEQMSYHIVMGTVTLVAGSKTVTLSGGAAFTSNSSYKCTLTDSTGLNLTAITYTSGSQFTILGVLTDNVSFVCVGT